MKIILNKKYVLTSSLLLALISGCSISQLSAAPQATQRNAAKKVEVASLAIPGLNVPLNHPDRATNTQVKQYLKSLAAKEFPKQYQGVWIQSDTKFLANHQGTVPMPAASLSKVATTLANARNFGSRTSVCHTDWHKRVNSKRNFKR